MQYPYYNPNAYWGNFPDMNIWLFNRDREKKDIRRLGNCIGGAILLYLALQNLFSIFLTVFGLSQFYYTSELFSKGTEILMIIFSILPSFMLFGGKMKNITGIAEPVALSKPKKPLHVFLAFFAGMGACMVANFVTSFFVGMMAVFGYELSSPDSGLPMGVSGITITVVQVVFVAALIEEFCLRGYVMGNLRRYGNGFAIFVSALIFGLLHGNLVQAPFALIVGVALGYFSIRTGSIWTGILIHAGNNLFSVVLSYVGEIFGDTALVIAYYAANLFFIVTGIVCFVFFQRLTKMEAVSDYPSVLSNTEKVRAVLLSPTIIIVIVLMVIVTMNYIAPIEQAVS